MTYISQNPKFDKGFDQVNGFNHFDAKADAFDLDLSNQIIDDKMAGQANLTLGPTFTCSLNCPSIRCVLTK